jgi:hypothetical protein
VRSCALRALLAERCRQPAADLDGAAIRFDKALLWALPQLAGGAKAAAAGQVMTGHPVLPWRRLPLCDNRGFSDVAALKTGGASLQTLGSRPEDTPEDTPWPPPHIRC